MSMPQEGEGSTEWEKKMEDAVGFFQLGQYEQAEKLSAEAIKAAEDSGADELRLARALIRLGGRIYHRNSARDPILTRAFAILEKHLAPENPDVISCLQLLDGIDRNHLFGEEVQKALLKLFKNPQLPHGEVAKLVESLGYALGCNHKDSEFERLYTQWLESAEKALRPDDERVTRAVFMLANHYKLRERYVRAESLYKRLLATEERSYGPDSTQVASILFGLGNLYIHQSRYKEAEPLLRRSAELDHWSTTLYNLATALKEIGRAEEAAEVSAQADAQSERE